MDNKSISSELNKQIESLCSMREDDFTREILKPLFEAMGYERVDFNGGPLERGRDLIAQIRVPPRKKLKVTYVQSKKVGSMQNTSTAAKLSTLLHQLRQCCKGKITTVDGEELSVDSVYLSCPEMISNRLIEELDSQLNEISPKVEIFDGPEIIAAIYEYKPELLSKLTTIEEKLTSTCNAELVNKELLSALKSRNKLSIDHYYSDLSFFVGSVDSNNLLHLEVVVEDDCMGVSKDVWAEVAKESTYFNEEFKLNILTDCIESIEKNYSKESELYNSPENRSNVKKLDGIQSEILSLTDRIRDKLTSLDSAIGSLLISKKLSPDERSELKDYTQHLKNVLSHGRERSKLSALNLNRELPKVFAKEVELIVELLSSLSQKKEIGNQLAVTIKPKPLYKFRMNGQNIISTIEKFKSRYFNDVKGINERTLGLSKIQRFLNETEKALTFISKLSGEETAISKYLRFKYKKEVADRVSISPHDIFATGHDIAIYGGAGVGKTTTLQAYASLMTDDKSKTIIYVPLNRLVGRLKSLTKDMKSTKYLKDNLIIKLILMSKGIQATDEQVQQTKAVLPHNLSIILDGLDEFYNTAPDILPGIQSFKESHPSAQLIISSRDCVSYLNKISFLGITLLPFTREQLSKFVTGWLDDSKLAETLLDNIEKLELYEHIKTPLLATITCSLAEKGVNTSTTEYEIYDDRLKLLTGEYDKHKDIERQQQKGDLLGACARRIAYRMHLKNTRSLTKDEMLAILQTSLVDHYSPQLLSLCLDELVDPCNIIIKDPLSGTYSFGHFRFQEHLAASELKLNRGIDLTDLVVHDWWRGTLGLYAQQNEFSHLFEDVYKKHSNIQRAKMTLEAMINSAPAQKRAGYYELLEQYSKSDYLDDIMAISDTFYDSQYDSSW